MIEVVPNALEGERLDRVVALLTGASRAEVTEAIAAGQVKLDGRIAPSGKVRVVEEQEIEVLGVVGRPPERPKADAGVEITVLHVDDDVIVVDKAAELVVHPGSGVTAGTLVNGLLARFPEIADVGQPDRPGIVHRLDRGTTGVLMVARSQLAYDSLVAQLAARTASRRYLAIVAGVPDNPVGLIDAPLGRSSRDRTRMAVTVQGREARTRYEVEQTFRDPMSAALVRCQLETGRTHQIRVHLAAIGHPVLGDARYGGVRAEFDVPRPMLHAASVTFLHPATDEPVTVSAPIPDDVVAVLARLTD
jgi:23S rRNA pseudouridine1911/1915/1917 synthase